ncbi:MAG: sugar ABC transporter permease [Planctomycetota bacterium]|nr:sugar ABC transporter permease [Planctomycetota bacterium]
MSLTAGVPASPLDPRRRAPRSRLQPRWAPWVFLTPFLLTFVIFTAYPLVQSLRLSFEQTFGPGASEFVGTRNYAALLRDPLFYTALKNTAWYTLGSLLVQLPLALLLAMLLETPGLRGRNIFRVLLFTPALVGVVFAAMIFAVILDRKTGLLNQSLVLATSWLPQTLRWDPEFEWLPRHAIAAMVIASLWMWVGFNMVYFSAALQNVRRDLVEAATVDGAGPILRFWHVTLPAIRPVASFVVLLSLIGSLQIFELPYLLLDVAGRPDDRGLTVIMYLYRSGFDAGDLGYASAIGWVLGLLLIALSLVERFLARGEAEGGA